MDCSIEDLNSIGHKSSDFRELIALTYINDFTYFGEALPASSLNTAIERHYQEIPQFRWTPSGTIGIDVETRAHYSCTFQ